MLHLASRCRSISRPLTAGSTTTTPSQSTIQPGPPGQRRAICSQPRAQFQACNLISTPTAPVLRRQPTHSVSISAHSPDSTSRGPNSHPCALSDNLPNPVAGQDLSTTPPFHQLCRTNPHLRYARQHKRRRARLISHLAARSAAATSLSKRLHTPTFHQRVCHRPP